MTLITIGLAAGTMLVMALIMTYILGWANTAFHVEVDERIENVIEALPGVNCGGCGYVGCGEYAEAVVLYDIPVNKCAPGGENVANELAQIMDVDIEESLPNRPVIHCGAGYSARLGCSEYLGEKSCIAANIVTDIQGCVYGCLGFGDCVGACIYDAIHMKNGLAIVDYEKCVGCGACADACPKNIIAITPFKSVQIPAVICSNKDAAGNVKKICKVGCLGCKACTRVSESFVVNNNLSSIDYDGYDPENMDDIIKACNKCPRGIIQFVGKPSC